MIRTTEDFRAALDAASRSGVPLVMIRTTDPASAITHVSGIINANNQTPLVRYDFIAGLDGMNTLGQNAVRDPGPCAPGEALAKAVTFPARTVFFFFHAQRIWDQQPDVLQGIWSLRDAFKANNRMLVLLSTLGTNLPPEIANDVMVFDEPLPALSDIHTIVTDLYSSNDVRMPDENGRERIADGLIGLGKFPAEQALSIALVSSLVKNRAEIDLDFLWDRKITAIENTRGLKIYRGKETYGDISGYEAAKKFLRRTFNGRNRPRAVVFQDEIEKAYAGVGTDLSGTKTELLGYQLTHMSETNAQGILCIGHPGTGKSLLGLATSGEFDVPCIKFNPAETQSGIVGSSGEAMRSCLATIEAVSQGKVLYIATCNSIGQLPPELLRRFKTARFFFPLPDAEERSAIWNLYFQKYKLPIKERDRLPNDEGWTGADIAECAYKAWDLDIAVREAAEYVVPLSISSQARIEALENEANGRYLSASEPGIYQRHQAPAAKDQRRKLTIQKGTL
jgi:hypothetical protein